MVGDHVAAIGGCPVRPAKLLERLLAGHLANVAYPDFMRLVEALGFRLVRVSASHRVYAHAAAAELLTIQPHRGEAKPYQIRQLLELVEVYNLNIRGKG
jgi:predicted RNA binding protein YcfA (HicA-like mRNA interferase family)